MAHRPEHSFPSWYTDHHCRTYTPLRDSVDGLQYRERNTRSLESYTEARGPGTLRACTEPHDQWCSRHTARRIDSLRFNSNISLVCLVLCDQQSLFFVFRGARSAATIRGRICGVSQARAALDPAYKALVSHRGNH